MYKNWELLERPSCSAKTVDWSRNETLPSRRISLVKGICYTFVISNIFVGLFILCAFLYKVYVMLLFLKVIFMNKQLNCAFDFLNLYVVYLWTVTCYLWNYFQLLMLLWIVRIDWWHISLTIEVKMTMKWNICCYLFRDFTWEE